MLEALLLFRDETSCHASWMGVESGNAGSLLLLHGEGVCDVQLQVQEEMRDMLERIGFLPVRWGLGRDGFTRGGL